MLRVQQASCCIASSQFINNLYKPIKSSSVILSGNLAFAKLLKEEINYSHYVKFICLLL